MKVAIDFKHRPSMCPRTRAVLRFLKAGDSSDTEDYLDDIQENIQEESGKNRTQLVQYPLESQFQNKKTVQHCESGARNQLECFKPNSISTQKSYDNKMENIHHDKTILPFINHVSDLKYNVHTQWSINYKKGSPYGQATLSRKRHLLELEP